MTTTPSQKDWMTQFRIQSFSDLDFVIGQNVGWPIGMTRGSPPEFKRRILAAAVSYQLSLSSIDYAAYGGIYIAASLLWLWLAEKHPPDRWDMIGAAICLVGSAIILFGPRTS